jgi:hypothetical protein
MRNLLVTSAMLAALSSTAIAQDLNNDVKRSANTISYKFTVCAALQGYNSRCLSNQDPTLKAKSEEAKKDFLDLALSSATVAGMKIPDMVVTRYQVAFREFQKQTNHSCTNISVLLERYAAPCKALMENAVAALRSPPKMAPQTAERSKQDPMSPPASPSIPPTGFTTVVPETSATTTSEPGATSQEFKKAVGEDIKQHPTTGTEKGLSPGKRLNPSEKSSVGGIYKNYADKLTAYLGLPPAATESARTTALAQLAAALADASKKPLSAEDVSAINTRLAKQDPALATALASAAPTLNQSIADTASALCCANGSRTGSN